MSQYSQSQMANDLHSIAGERPPENDKHSICMISDFFFPSIGGVETHIWNLSQCLIQLGHKVIVVTHKYGDRQGIRYMTNGLKVYYLPLNVIYDQVIFPTFYSFFPLFRNILIRERITVVHGHQSTSTMTNECIMYARTMGCSVCLTDHSLFGFADVPSIHINKILEIVLSDVGHVVCVSNTCRENLVLRSRLHPSFVSTIPNAVNSSHFTPNPSQRLSNPYPNNHSSATTTVNIVMLSRLVYRKGIDLAVEVIPIICQSFPDVHFIIGGDGPLRLLLEEMTEKYQLHRQVELIGEVSYQDARNVLTRGHIFLNCSLTESFCMALLEASSCGLLVVSTNVGGIPEVLPPSMVHLAEPTPASLVTALCEAIVTSKKIVPQEFHERIQVMYNWLDVARRTVLVYDSISGLPIKPMTKESTSPYSPHASQLFCLRILRYMSVGWISGSVMCVVITFMHCLWCLCEYFTPFENIEPCENTCALVCQANSKQNQQRRLR